MARNGFTAIVIAVGVGVAGGAAAQDSIASRPSIIVVGAGQAEAAPDRFVLTAELKGRGQTQDAATEQLAALQARVSDGLQHLDGLTAARLTTGLPTIEPTYAPDCGREGYDRDRSDCPITGYSTSMSVNLDAGPAARGGDAVSLAGELGAETASLSSVYLSSREALQAEAGRRAYADAKRQADAIAAASGQHIVRVLRVQDPSAQMSDLQANNLGDVVVTGSRMRRARTGLTFTPGPVTESARLTVTFEIE